MNAETVRSAFRCGNNYCICYKGGNTHCPAHADNSPSLTITDGGDKLLYKCHAGCSQDKIIQALQAKDLHRVPDTPDRDPVAVTYTVDQYSEEKRIPKIILESDFLLANEGGRIKIPYFDQEGKLACTRYRSAGKSFRWKRGDDKNIILYGLWRMKTNEDSVLIVEGESDCHTLWYAGFNAIGVPGAQMWKPHFEKYFESFKDIYVVIEPDQGGNAVLKWLINTSFKDRVKLITSDTLEGHKDPSDLWLSDPGDVDLFRERMSSAVNNARSWDDYTSVHQELPKTEDVSTEGLLGVGTYRILWNQYDIYADIYNMTTTRDGELRAEIAIRSTRPTKRGLLRRQTLTLTATQSKNSFAKSLYNADGSIVLDEWEEILEVLCDKLLTEHREEEDPVLLTGKADESFEIQYTVKPILEKNTITTIFGQGGSGKSYFAMYIALLAASGKNHGGLSVERTNTGYLDWETNENDAKRRRQELCEALNIPVDSLEEHGIYYKYMDKNLVDSADKIREWIEKYNIGNIVVDSVGAAFKGDVTTQESVSRNFEVLRGLRVSITLLDHSNKTDTGPDALYGSVFKKNWSRNMFELLRIDDFPQGEMGFSLVHWKANNQPIQNVMAWHGKFENNRLVSFERMSDYQIQNTDAKKHLKDWDLVQVALTKNEKLTVQEIADYLEKPVNNVGPLLSKWKSRGWLIHNPPHWSLSIGQEEPTTPSKTRLEDLVEKPSSWVQVEENRWEYRGNNDNI